MLDTTSITSAIAAMIRTGTTGRQLITAITVAFPDLSPTELSQALQVAQAHAERKALRPH
jgi:uncharacterized protein (DUF433 family)